MSDEEEKFDAIIIGAGPAGSACAYILAREGKNVLVVERGDTPGSKNMFGGRLYAYALEQVEPGLYKDAEFERRVVREQMMVLGEKTGVTMDYYSEGDDDTTPSYTLSRAAFDAWFSEQAENQGAMVAPGVLVDDLIYDGDKVVGIKTGEDEMYADVVISAEGINALIAQKAGLKEEWKPTEVAVGAKEVIELPADVITKRFAVNSDDEGAACMILGQTHAQGGGFIYTNKDSISLGMVVSPASLAQQKTSLADLFQDFKNHPAIRPLIAGGTTSEYSGHLVPEGGYNSMPKKLYRTGFLMTGDAAGFCINTGTIIRGMDLAILSGVAAARAVLAAKNPEEVGPAYMDELEKIGVMPTMRLFAGWPQITGIPRMTKTYPDMINEMMGFMFHVDGKVPEKMPKAMRNIMKKHVGFGQLLADAWKGFRAI